MADFFDKAKAMWSALDEMAEKNPEKYAKFIQDQLYGKETQEMFKQLKLDAPSTLGKSAGLSDASQVQQRNTIQVQNSEPNTSKVIRGSGDGVANHKSGERIFSPLCKIVQRDESEDEETIKELRIPSSVASRPSKSSAAVRPNKLIEEL